MHLRKPGAPPSAATLAGAVVTWRFFRSRAMPARRCAAWMAARCTRRLARLSPALARLTTYIARVSGSPARGSRPRLWHQAS
jgi:hypothetical protein